MGTDYDTWLLNIVEGEDVCGECECEECECESEDEPNDNADTHEAERQYENWLESLKDRGGR